MDFNWRVWLRWAFWAWLASVAFYESVAAWIYVTGDPQNFTAMFRAKYVAYLPIVVTHGTSAIVTLAVGPLQFLGPLRRGWPRLHRLLGQMYLLGVLLGGLTGLAMGTIAEGGRVGQSGFIALALAWLFTGWQAFSSARRRQIREHERWMMRNFALTFGAVMLRVYIHGAEKLGLDVATVYPWTAWLGWVPNLVVIELYLRRKYGRERGR